MTTLLLHQNLTNFSTGVSSVSQSQLIIAQLTDAAVFALGLYITIYGICRIFKYEPDEVLEAILKKVGL